MEFDSRRNAAVYRSLTARPVLQRSALCTGFTLLLGPAFDSSPLPACNTSLATVTTITSAFGMVTSPMRSSFTVPVPTGVSPACPVSIPKRVPPIATPAPTAFFVNGCGARVGIDDQTRTMTVQRTRDIKVIGRV
jgi:hypothetical protein